MADQGDYWNQAWLAPRVTIVQNWFNISFYGVAIIEVSFTAWTYSLRALQYYEASISGQPTRISTVLMSVAITGDHPEN